MSNVLIIPTSDRSGQASLIDHYNRSGWRVYVPRFNTLDLEWKYAATWPALLCNSSMGERNIVQENFIRQDEFFGEDFFLKDFSPSRNDKIAQCTIVDLTIDQVKIDVVHTLRGGEIYLGLYTKMIQKYLSDPKWISSSLNPWDGIPGSPKNVAKFLPASYENISKGNSCDIFCTDCEFDLLDVERKTTRLPVIASFNHNFAVRHPEDYRLFCQMNDVLDKSKLAAVVNYGGNVRKLGADIRYSENGPTGTWKTLSPREALRLTTQLSAVLHLKQTDWGGGVFYYALHCHTPVITTRRYVKESNSHRFLVNDYNAILVDDLDQLVMAVKRIYENPSLVEMMSKNMAQLESDLFNDNYWKNWNEMLERVS